MLKTANFLQTKAEPRIVSAKIYAADMHNMLTCDSTTSRGNS